LKFLSAVFVVLAAPGKFYQIFAESMDRRNACSSGRKVKQIIVEQLQVDDAEVTPSASFQEDLGADSSRCKLSW